MSDIADFLNHRAKILELKASILSANKPSALMAAELDKDIQAIDRLIELAIKQTPTTQQGK